MARAPRPGACKTRLIPLLGAEGCARLQERLIRHTAAWASAATSSTWLAFEPLDALQEMAGLLPPGVQSFPQVGGDLGERLRAAADRVFASQHWPVAVIGTDAVELSAVHLRLASRAIAAGHDACLIPALDGGYALIALARPTPAAFQLPRQAWGGPDVLALTLAALEDAGCSYALTEPVRDLDTPADARQIAAEPRCPATIAEIIRGALRP